MLPQMCVVAYQWPHHSALAPQPGLHPALPQLLRPSPTNVPGPRLPPPRPALPCPPGSRTQAWRAAASACCRSRLSSQPWATSLPPMAMLPPLQWTKAQSKMWQPPCPPLSQQRLPPHTVTGGTVGCEQCSVTCTVRVFRQQMHFVLLNRVTPTLSLVPPGAGQGKLLPRAGVV